MFMDVDYSNILLKYKKPISNAVWHHATMDGDTRKALANNLKMLIDHYDLSQKDLESKSGVSQRTISNMVRHDSGHCPSIENVEAVARAFRLKTWQLLIPGAPLEILLNATIEKVVDNFVHSTIEGRDMITRVAHREAAIAASLDKKTG